ncbi:hypothetical protein [Sphingobium sp. B2]|uniref:hypothetical protein n=1 Tax=Sphingobium sp. B2 TaxID=2583228 RepID=UPI0011A1D93E|nr:hypothetical protein [Sphingobium sp. B2]
MSGLATDRWVAVTGAAGHAVQVRDASDRVRRPQDRIIVGNWADPVSYTHLDVYKRQGAGSGWRCV